MMHRIDSLRRTGFYGSVGLALGLISPLAVADDPVELNQMVVTASGYAQDVRDAPASISILPREQLEKGIYRDVTDALSDVPGVMVTGGGSSSDISIRGMGGKYTLILVDGKRQGSRETRPNGDNSGIEQGWMPPLSAIDHIEVIRGPMSSLYGSDALGGVINIITRKAKQEWNGQITAQTVYQGNRDSGDSHQGNFYLSGPIIKDKLNMELYGDYSSRDEDDITDGFANQDMANGTAKLDWLLSENQDIEFEAGHERQTRRTRPGKSLDIDSTPNDQIYERDHYAITHDLRRGANDFKTYLTHERITNPARDMTYRDEVLNHQTVLNFSTNTLTLGGQYQYQKLQDSGNQTGDLDELTRWQYALFAEDEYYLTDDIAVTTGLRFNKDENYGSHVTPRIYGVWHVDNDWTVKGGVSSGYRSPDLRQASPGWGQITGGPNAAVPSVIIGNPDLDPEKSVNREIGFNWTNHNGVDITANAYYTTYKDKISEDHTCDTDAGDASCTFEGENYHYISERVNVDEVVMQGVELNGSFDLPYNLNLAGNYTYTESEQKSGQYKGMPLNRLPKHRLNSTLTWNRNGRVSAWGRVNYYGESSDGTGHRGIQEKIPSYTLVDTGLSYKVTPKATVYTGIYNLFDKHVDYDTYEKVLDGRRLYAKVQLDF